MADFSIETVDIINPADYPIGIIKDSWISEKNKTTNYGPFTPMTIGEESNGGAFGGRLAAHIVLEIQMPEKKDIPGMDDIISAEIVFYVTGQNVIDSTYLVIGIVEVPDDFDEGPGGTDWCNWNEYIDSVPWTRGPGACKSRHGTSSEDGTVFDTIRFPLPLSGVVTPTFNLTDALSDGDKKRFAIFVIDDDVSASPNQNDIAYVDFASKEHATPSYRPILRLTYRDYQVEAFTDKKDALTIEPNPDNPEQPLLKWGGVKDEDFVDFKLYRDVVPITTIAGMTGNGKLLATIADNSDQEYVDDDAVDPLVDGHTYYYVVIAEDGHNTLDDATFSKNVNFTKPEVTTAILSPSGNQNTGIVETMSVQSPQNIKKLFVDWGDGLGTSDDVESWYEYEVVGTSKTATHIYSMYTGGVGIGAYVRVQDELGFWSSLTGCPTSLIIDDTDPTAKLRVSVKKETLGDYITLDGSLSQPAGSNVTITKYEFKRDAAELWQDNGTNPVYTFDSGIYPNSTGVKTASLQITTNSTKTDTDTATYELETGTPTTLSFSKDTKIHELNHTLGQNKVVDIPTGSDGVEHELLISRKAERVTLTGTSNHPNTGDDIGLIRSAWLNNTYVRILANTEMEDHIVQYDCKIDGDISLGQSFDNKQSWSFPVRVIARTEVITAGDISAFAYVNPTTTRVTSANHGLSITDFVLITNTVNYNGTYTVTNPTTNTFDIAHPFKVAITGINQGTNKFTISGKYAHLFGTNKKFDISGSTGNDGTYQVSTSANVGGNTEIIVVESIPSAVVDGYIEFGNDGLGRWTKVGS